MRALISTPDAAEPVAIQDVPEPAPGPDELLLDVRAFSVNRGELFLLPTRPGWRPGQDVAGIVARAAAGGGGPREGARVVAAIDEGGWAERAAVPTYRAAEVPDSLDLGAAAALGVAGLTALRALRLGGHLLGRRVLVTGASGGVGTLAVQLAAIAGAEVTASAAKAAGLRELGAAALVGEDAELPGPFDLVMEGVGGPSLERSVHALGPGAVAVLYGSVGGQARIGLGDFRGGPGARVQSFFIYSTGVETFGRDLGLLVRLTAEGRLRPQVGLDVRWTELGTALRALQERRVIGKVVARVT